MQNNNVVVLENGIVKKTTCTESGQGKKAFLTIYTGCDPDLDEAIWQKELCPGEYCANNYECLVEDLSLDVDINQRIKTGNTVNVIYGDGDAPLFNALRIQYPGVRQATDDQVNIILGGPCANQDAGEFLGITSEAPECFEEFDRLYGQGGVFVGDDRVLVAGFDLGDTQTYLNAYLNNDYLQYLKQII
jgi:hypothetical protein